jgi:hypothetical protein
VSGGVSACPRAGPNRRQAEAGGTPPLSAGLHLQALSRARPLEVGEVVE